MSSGLLQDRRIRQSIESLQRMGLKLATVELEDDVILLAIDIDSILEVLKKNIGDKLTYKKFTINVDWDEKLFMIYFWRGERPRWLMEKKVES